MIAKIKWEIELEYPVDCSDYELVEFYLEESHCQENLLNYLVSQSEPGRCKLCSIGKVTLLELIES